MEGFSHSSCRGLKETSHVLDGQDVNAFIHQLLGEVEVVLEL